jgi:hypothetical protein
MLPVVDYCTYFDSGYLPRGLALYHSLRRHAPTATLHVLALDDETHRQLSRLSLPGLKVIRLDEFEQDDAALLAAKSNRSGIEYYFTCTPKLPLYVLDRNPHLERVFYVDADFYFFSPAQAMIEEMGAGSIYIVEHRFPEALRSLEQFGRFNVGVLGFRNDIEGRRCLAQWREQCNTWCYDRLEDGKFADQKYLDQWPNDFQGVVISQHPGINVAPWNKSRFTLDCRGHRPHVDGQPVVCFHYHGLRFHSHGVVEPQCNDYGMRLDKNWFRLIYRPYLHAIRRAEQLLKSKRHSAPRSSSAVSLEELIRRSSKTQLLLRCGPITVEAPSRVLRTYLRVWRRFSQWGASR